MAQAWLTRLDVSLKVLPDNVSCETRVSFVDSNFVHDACKRARERVRDSVWTGLILPDTKRAAWTKDLVAVREHQGLGRQRAQLVKVVANNDASISRPDNRQMTPEADLDGDACVLHGVPKDNLKDAVHKTDRKSFTVLRSRCAWVRVVTSWVACSVCWVDASASAGSQVRENRAASRQRFDQDFYQRKPRCERAYHWSAQRASLVEEEGKAARVNHSIAREVGDSVNSFEHFGQLFGIEVVQAFRLKGHVARAAVAAAFTAKVDAGRELQRRQLAGLFKRNHSTAAFIHVFKGARVCNAGIKVGLVVHVLPDLLVASRLLNGQVAVRFAQLVVDARLVAADRRVVCVILFEPVRTIIIPSFNEGSNVLRVPVLHSVPVWPHQIKVGVAVKRTAHAAHSALVTPWRLDRSNAVAIKRDGYVVCYQHKNNARVHFAFNNLIVDAVRCWRNNGFSIHEDQAAIQHFNHHVAAI